MQGPWVTPDYAMKKIVQTQLTVSGPKKLNVKLAQPEIVDDYYNDICVQAIRLEPGSKKTDPQNMMEVTSERK